MYLRTCSNSKPTVDTAYPRAQKCSPVKFRSLPHKRAIAMALFPFRNPIAEATGYFGGIAMHMCTWSGSRCPSMIWHSFCRANAWNTSPNLRSALPNSTLRRRLRTTPHDTYSPNWNALTFDNFRHNILHFLALTKPRGMLCPNGTVKPFLVSLVEPVAYLKSELIISHWDAVRTILLPPENSCEPEGSHPQLGCSQGRPHAS